MSLHTDDNCSKCGTSLQGDAIPAHLAESYLPATHWRREIGVEYGYDAPAGCHYDGVSEWRCPDCGYREGRWSGRELADGEFEPRYGAAR